MCVLIASMCLFSHGRSCYRKGQRGMCGFDYWPDREIESNSYPLSMATEQNAMAHLIASRPPCLTLESTEPILDQFL